MPEHAAARKLHEFAVEIRQLAYQTPAGQGEWELLRVSQRMMAEADRHLRRTPQARAQDPASSASRPLM